MNNFDTSIIIYLTQKVDLIDINISWKCIFLESSVRYLSKEMKHISRYVKGEKHVKNSHFFCLRALTHYSFLLNSRFLNDLRHKGSVYQSVCGIFIFDLLLFWLKFKFLFKKKHRLCDLEMPWFLLKW